MLPNRNDTSTMSHHRFALSLFFQYNLHSFTQCVCSLFFSFSFFFWLNSWWRSLLVYIHTHIHTWWATFGHTYIVYMTPKRFTLMRTHTHTHKPMYEYGRHWHFIVHTIPLRSCMPVSFLFFSRFSSFLFIIRMSFFFLSLFLHIFSFSQAQMCSSFFFLSVSSIFNFTIF